MRAHAFLAGFKRALHLYRLRIVAAYPLKPIMVS